MLRKIPSPPLLLQRAAHGDRNAVLDLVRARREDVYQFAADLIAGKLEAAAKPLHAGASRKKQEREEHARDESGEYPVGLAHRDDPLGPETLLRSWHLVQELHRALCALDDRALELVVLIDIEGLASDQVAWLLDLSEAEIYLGLRSARRQLRDQLLSRRAHAQPA